MLLNLEQKNYLRVVFHSPRHLFAAMFHFFAKAYRYLKKKTTHRLSYYPDEIRDIVVLLLNKEKTIKWKVPISTDEKYLTDIKKSCEIDNEIDLAGTKIICKENKVPWNKSFQDQEDTFSLHRWNFLLTKISREGISKELLFWGEQQIGDWLSIYLKLKQGPPWSSYTVGERICNATLFFIYHNKTPNDRIINGLASFADYLSKNLEYNGKYFTGNHVFNNARALYFAGQCLGVESWCSIARLIIKREIKELITFDGFLREGSSHYNFLFTRWAIEIYWIAKKFGDEDLALFFEPYIKVLTSKCWFFLVWNETKKEWSIPLIGDVSPDFRPEWLLDVPWSNIASSLYKPCRKLPVPPEKGWASLFGRTEKETGDPVSFDDLYSYDKSGWYRIKCGEFLFFFHAEPNGTPDYPGHCHNDIGSFSLYVRGVPLLIDSGRLNYSLDQYSNYGISAFSHNTICIDGFECLPFIDRRWYPKIYRSKKSRVNIEKCNQGYNVNLYMDGFQRIYNENISVVRNFKIQEKTIFIEDFFHGSGTHRIETRFHFSPEITINDTKHKGEFELRGDFGISKFQVKDNSDQVCETIRGNDKPIGGWYFPKYGEKQKTTTIFLSEQRKFPTSIKYQLVFE